MDNHRRKEHQKGPRRRSGVLDRGRDTKKKVNLMRYVRSVLTYLALSGAAAAFAAGTLLQQGRDQYDRQNYEEALDPLQRAYAEQKSPEAARYLGLTYYQLLRYAQARPLLQQASAASPNDATVLSALAHVALQTGDIEAARGYLKGLQKISSNAADSYEIEGRIEMASGREAEAIAAFQRAVDLDPTSPAGGDLLRLYAKQGDTAKARQVAEAAVAAKPDSFQAGQFNAALSDLEATSKPLSVYLGYRYETDSNAVLEPNTPVVIPGVKDKSDQRQVLTGDLLGRYRIGGNWEAFGEAHLYNSWHQELSQYDNFRQNYLLGLGWSGPTYGFRLPYEYTNITLDGGSYLSENRLAPGAFVRLNDATLYGFYRYRDLSYKEDVGPSEERSGNANSLGALLLVPFHNDRGLLRVVAEGGSVATDGRNWDRDEGSIFANLSYGLTSRLSGSVGFQWDKQQYNNVHDIYLVKRDDEATTLFAALTYLITKDWEVRLQGSWVNWDSNIPAYDYDRTVGSLGITWKY